MAKKTSGYIVSPLLQKVFIGLSIGAYIAQLSTILPAYVTVYSWNFQLSQFSVLVFSSVILPLVLFALAYFVVPKKDPLTWRLFMAMFLTLVGTMVGVVITQLLQGITYEILREQIGAIDNLALWQLAPSLIALAVYVVIISRYKTSKPPSGSLTLAMVRAYVALMSSTIVLSTAPIIYHMANQYPTNPNFSGFVMPLAQIILLPLLLFSIAYLTAQKKTGRTYRVAEAALLTGVGLLLFTVVEVISRYSAPLLLEEGQYGSWMAYELGAMGASLLTYSLLVWRVRH